MTPKQLCESTHPKFLNFLLEGYFQILQTLVGNFFFVVLSHKLATHRLPNKRCVDTSKQLWFYTSQFLRFLLEGYYGFLQVESMLVGDWLTFLQVLSYTMATHCQPKKRLVPSNRQRGKKFLYSIYLHRVLNMQNWTSPRVQQRHTS